MKKVSAQFIILLFAIILIVGCSKKESKENALNYLSKMNEYVISKEYKDFLKSCFNEGVGSGMTGVALDDKKMEAIINKKSDEIAKSLGFNTGNELEAIVDKFKDDKDVKEKFEVMSKNVQLAVEEITKEMTAKMQEELQKKTEETPTEIEQTK